MLVALVVNKEIFSPSEVLSALAVCMGLILFAFADMAGDTKVSTPLGLALQGGSVVADAFLPNLQQALFKKGGGRPWHSDTPLAECAADIKAQSAPNIILLHVSLISSHDPATGFVRCAESRSQRMKSTPPFRVADPHRA
jgi:hypothetical protein